MRTRLETLQVVSFPAGYLAYLGCKDQDTYFKSIVDVRPTHPLEVTNQQLRINNLAKNSGSCIFRHIKTMKTATFSYAVDEVLLDNSDISKFSVLAITRITNIVWMEDDDYISVIGHLTCLIKLNVILWRQLEHKDKPFIAIPLRKFEEHHICLTDRLREILKFHLCELGINVTYKKLSGNQDPYITEASESSFTYRSILFPESTIWSPICSAVEHDGIWSVMDIRSDKPIVLEMSATYWELIGEEEISCQFRILCTNSSICIRISTM